MTNLYRYNIQYVDGTCTITKWRPCALKRISTTIDMVNMLNSSKNIKTWQMEYKRG